LFLDVLPPQVVLLCGEGTNLLFGVASMDDGGAEETKTNSPSNTGNGAVPSPPAETPGVVGGDQPDGEETIDDQAGAEHANSSGSGATEVDNEQEHVNEARPGASPSTDQVPEASEGVEEVVGFDDEGAIEAFNEVREEQKRQLEEAKQKAVSPLLNKGRLETRFDPDEMNYPSPHPPLPLPFCCGGPFWPEFHLGDGC